MTPPPRLVPDRPSDAAIAQAFFAYSNGWRATDSLEHRLEIIQKAREFDAEYGIRQTLTERLQQKCSDWGTYWRAPDAHGVILSTEQALELLRDALGVEVEIDAAAPPAEAPAERGAHVAELTAMRDAEIDDYFYPSRKQHAALDAAIQALAAAPAAPAEGKWKRLDFVRYFGLVDFAVGGATLRLTYDEACIVDGIVKRVIADLSTPRVTGGREVAALPAKWRAEADDNEVNALEADSIGLNEAANNSDRRAKVLRELADELDAALQAATGEEG